MQLHRVKGVGARQSNIGNVTVVDSDDEGGGTQTQTQTQAGQTHSISMHQAETLLSSFVAEGWFECSRRKYYSLAPRALMELRGWLIETYNDDEDEDVDDDEEETPPTQRIRFCAACKEIVTVGQRCADLDCAGRLHDACTGTMWRSLGGREVCPVCKKSWTEHGFVGERAEAQNGRRSTGDGGAVVASSSRILRQQQQARSGAEVNGEDDDDDDEDAEGEEDDDEG